MVSRELRLRDKSLVKVAQGSSVQFRSKTTYAGLNRDGHACGLLVDGTDVKIFLVENSTMSVSGHEIPLDVDGNMECDTPSGRETDMDATQAMLVGF